MGRYQFAPTAVLTISRQDGRMFAQLTGQPAAEIFPSSEREFFYKAVDAQLTFTAGADGRVTALVLRQNGAEQQARRVD